ncbi:MAG: ABC transporter substrate-binding protein, partial [Actinobacteria bacterium]|nr:ABC transporter substrate-binding protein [Actinomycetota bacterium]
SWASDGGDPSVLRLGYFLNVTHVVPIVGLQERFFAEALPGVRIEGKIFKSGPELISAMLSGGIDAAYVGPGPVIVAASRAPRQFRILAGAYDAGALLVARRDSSIRSVRDLDGQRVALPALHNTQDLNLRILIEKQGLRTTLDGGSVNMIQIRNADLANALRTVSSPPPSPRSRGRRAWCRAAWPASWSRRTECSRTGRRRRPCSRSGVRSPETVRRSCAD